MPFMNKLLSRAYMKRTQLRNDYKQCDMVKHEL